MKRMSFIFVVLYFGLLVMACDAPATPDSILDASSPSSPPPFYNVQLSFEKLPGEDHSERLTYTITITGRDSSLNHLGDTLYYMFIGYETSDWVASLNAYADTLWQGRIAVGQKIVLEPIFGIDKDRLPADITDGTSLTPSDGDTTQHIWTRISLRVMILRSEYAHLFPPEDIWEKLDYYNFTFSFDHRTGEYKQSYYMSILGPDER